MSVLHFIAVRRFNYFDMASNSAIVLAMVFHTPWWILAVSVTATASVLLERKAGVLRVTP